jgi:uncharacterized protein YllA (UPF0747 family)
MNAQRLPWWEQPRPLTVDEILRRNPEARNKALLPHEPSIASMMALADGVARVPTASVLEHLRAFNNLLGNERALPLVEQLLEPGCVVTTAGQQPALFGGPLLALHKAAGAVLLARELRAVARRPVVPIYWVHDVDHDLGEANRALVPTSGDFEQVRVPLVHNGQPLERYRLDADCAELIAQWTQKLGMAAGSALDPRAGEPLSQWSTRALLAALPENMPIVCASAAALSRSGRPFLEELHARHHEIQRAAENGARAVQEAGLVPQVNPRSGSRVWMIDEHGVRRPASETLENHYELSPGALLRPLLEQWLLPVVAHVNGPAENAYFAQLAPMFACLALPTPVAFPRPSIFWANSSTQRLLLEQHLEAADVVRGVEHWPREAGDGARVHVLASRLWPQGRPQERKHHWWAISQAPANALERYDVLDLRISVMTHDA